MGILFPYSLLRTMRLVKLWKIALLTRCYLGFLTCSRNSRRWKMHLERRTNKRIMEKNMETAARMEKKEKTNTF